MMQVLGLQAYDDKNDEVILGAKIISIDGEIEVWLDGEKVPDADVIYSYASINANLGCNSRALFGITSMRLRSRKKASKGSDKKRE